MMVGGLLRVLTGAPWPVIPALGWPVSSHDGGPWLGLDST